jgi:serine/threonine protein phosphatase PrpC
VVSDGAGGHGGGDVASRTVVSTVLKDFAACPEVSVDEIAALVGHAQQALRDEQRTSSHVRDMRATVAILMIDRLRNSALWGHVGDTRIYCFRGGRILMKTRDHSVIQSMYEAGLGDLETLRHHPYRGVLLSALGGKEAFETSVAQAPLPLQDGDVMLMCTDGMWDHVADATMLRLLRASTSGEEWLVAMEGELLKSADSNCDNYTAMSVWVRGDAQADVAPGEDYQTTLLEPAGVLQDDGETTVLRDVPDSTLGGA